MSTVRGDSDSPDMAGIVGSNSVNGVGIWGEANPNGRGIVGVSETGVGVWGALRSGRAVVGAVDEDGTGVWGEVKTGTGVVGAVHEGQGAGVSGRCDTGDGVIGMGRRGVVGMSADFQGVYGHSVQNSGVVGESDNMHAVFAITHSATSAGIYATNTAGGDAASFEGTVYVTKNIRFPKAADVAEHFMMDGEADAVPGTVVVIAGAQGLRPCEKAYDRGVVGVVSGAGSYRPALVLDDRGDPGTRPVALAGKVWCLVDADVDPVDAGDLLTTSSTPGHAMKAAEPALAFGAVLGKALGALTHGRGLVPILVSLQ